MTLLTADSLSKKFADKVILDKISFSINSGERIGLVGKNGTGKTTLFEILMRNISPDAGSLNIAKNCLIEYTEQENVQSKELSLFEFVAAARSDLLKLKEKIEKLEHLVSRNPEDKIKLEKLGELHNRFETGGGFSLENHITAILDGLGFEPKRHQDQLKKFSGGEKNRAALAKLLAGNGNLMLLDEPTNHLDIETTIWLEEFINKSDKAFIIVSHDRAFLQATVSKIWDLTLGQLEFYSGGFDKFLAERIKRREIQQHKFIHQKQEIERLEEYIRRNMAGQKTKQAQSKMKYLARIERIEAPKADRGGATISMATSGRSFAHVVSVDNVTLAYADNIIIEQAGFDLFRGDKAALIGRNGSGKTTILKALTGELGVTAGEVRIGNNVEIAYFDQELENLNMELTVLESAWQLEPQAEAGKIRSYLARFGFSGDESLSKVSSLSGGEKTKLSLALLLYHPANFIIMDEPTNHLDLESREALEKALLEYQGTFLIVSHDRYFLNKVANKILHIDNGGLKAYDGNYADFKQKTAGSVPAVSKKPAGSKKAYLAFKEKSKRKSKHVKEIKSAKSELSELEKELIKIEAQINSEIPKTDWEKLNEASENKSTTEKKILQLIARLEELEGTKLD